MTYFLVETDCNYDCPGIMETFTNKRKAEQACRVEKRAQKARNDLRRSERAGGYSNNKYIVTNSDKFEKRKFWEHVNRSTIIFE